MSFILQSLNPLLPFPCQHQTSRPYQVEKAFDMIVILKAFNPLDHLVQLIELS